MKKRGVKQAPPADANSLPPKRRVRQQVLPAVDEANLPPEARKQVHTLQAFSERLIEENNGLWEENAHLKDEVAILKGEKKRPVFKPSRMNEEAGKADPSQEKGPKPPRRAGSAKRSKTAQLEIHYDKIIQPTEPVPPGSRFKGYRDYTVQEIVIMPVNTRYRLARWQTPDGRRLTGQLPEALQGRHFGPNLVSYILYQHHHCHVTQPLLHEQLREWKIDISSGQVNALLLGGKARFHEEKDAILSAGLALSSYITVDDTGARHQGNNGYVTHIGNPHFAWFQSSESKSRINFLELLRAGQTDYRINTEALDYMKNQGLSKVFLDAFSTHPMVDFTDKAAWENHMKALGMDTPRYRRIATEGALLGSLSGLHIAKHLAIISDDAGQFNVLIRGLCWVHAERLVHKMLPLNDQHRVDIAQVRSQIWALYADLKSYKAQPREELKEPLKKRFDEIFTQKTSYTSLNRLLLRLHQNKSELLLVLERPEIPLHTNGSEGDIRGHVQKQKISGGTRSDVGRKCRDTFSSLKKTCRKLGISFWSYLTDRISFTNQIQPLNHIIEQRITSMQNGDANPLATVF
jgi:hypothetical protein